MTKIETYIRGHMNANAKFVAKKFGKSVSYVYVLKHKIKKELEKEKGLAPITFAITNKPPKRETVDSVNHPSHYKTGGIETIDFIEAKKLDYHLGNVIKYITRADHKGNKLEDLKKAQWYLNRAIDNLTK